MATHRMSLMGILVPGTSGNVIPQPSSIADANDLYPSNMVLLFKNTATKDSASFAFRVPKNYVGTPKFYALWKINLGDATKDVVWDVDYRAIAAGEDGDPTTHQESLTVTSAANATARRLIEALVAATAGNFAVDDLVMGLLSRDGADAADDAAADAELLDFGFEYTDA